MFRARGKPDDPINIKVAQQHKYLSDAIQINPLNQFIDSRPDLLKQKEIQRRRQHFDQFRETYQERLQKYQKRAWNGARGKTSEFSIRHFFADSPRTEPVNERKPVYVKAPLKPMKTVTVEIPLIAQQNAVWCPGKLNSRSSTSVIRNTKPSSQKTWLKQKPQPKETCDIIRKLKELESGIKKPERRDSGMQVEVMQEIEEVQEEIDIAELQLKQINSLIESKKLNPSRSSQTASNKPKPEKSSTTWMVEHGAKNDDNNKKRDDCSGAKRLATTLSVLSRRLQEMQDKFKSKSTYRSIKDYLSNRQSVEVIYKNRNFKPKVKELSYSPDTKQVLGILKHNQSAKYSPEPEKPAEVCNVPCQISKPRQELYGMKSPHKKDVVVPANTDKDDEMSAYFDVDLLKSIMKSQFLQKEFKEEMKTENPMTINTEMQCSGLNAVFSSADLVSSQITQL